MVEARNGRRAAIATWLHRTAMILTVIPVIITILLLVAGTFYVPNSAREGSFLIGLSNLNMVSFDGIITSNDTTPGAPSFLVKLLWFPNAFAWSWPEAPPTQNYQSVGAAPLTTSGILTRGPQSRFEPFAAIRIIPGTTGGIVDIPFDEYACIVSSRDTCSNPFWNMVRRTRGFSFTQSLGWFSFVLYVSAGVVALVTLATEWIIRRHPWWMRCQCWGPFKRVCPLPKGPREEVEAMDDAAWDRVRLFYYGMITLYFVLPALHDSAMGAVFVSSLQTSDNFLPRGMSMNAKQGGLYLALVWLNVVIALLAFLCMCARRCLTARPKGWMEQQQQQQIPAGVSQEEGIVSPVPSTKASVESVAAVPSTTPSYTDLESGETKKPVGAAAA